MQRLKIRSIVADNRNHICFYAGRRDDNFYALQIPNAGTVERFGSAVPWRENTESEMLPILVPAIAG